MNKEKNNKKTITFFRLIFWTGLACLLTSEVSAQNLREAVKTALETHPEIEALNYGRKAARNIQAQAYAGYLPNLDMRTATGYEFSDNPATRNRVNGNEELHPVELKLALSLNLFEGFKTQSQVTSSTNNAIIITIQVKEVAEGLALQTTQVYLDILKYEHLVSLATDNVKTHLSLLDLVKQRVTQQVGSKSDESQVLSRLKAAKATLRQYEGLLANTQAIYKSKVNTEPVDLSLPTPPKILNTSNVTQEAQMALKLNPLLGQARANIAMAKAEHLVRKAAYYPRVDLEVSAAHNNNLSGTPERSDSVAAMAILTQNFFTGGQDYHRAQETYNLLQQAKSELEQAERDVVEHVKIIFNSWQMAKKKKELFATQMIDDERVKEAFFQQFAVKKRTLLDLLISENTLFLSKTNHINERFLEMLAPYRLLAAQGKLLEGLQVRMPEGAMFEKMTITDIIPKI